MNNDQLTLVDGSSYLYRAYHALPPLKNAAGEPTGAIYGVLNMILKLYEDYAPRYFAVVFDAPGKTFRDEMFAEYKANRPEMPEDLQSQIAPLKAIIQAWHIPLLTIEGVEADDVIATLTKQAEQHGLSTLISTGDKDLAQLVNDNVSLINTMSNTVYDGAKVVEKFNVEPSQIVDYLTLVGDTSDNIPGVSGVGPKTAAKWLNHYQTLDQLIAQADKIKGKVGDKLRNHLGQLQEIRELVKVKTDVELPYRLQDLQPGEPDKQALKQYYEQYEFRRLLKNLLAEEQTESTAGGDSDYVCITDETTLKQWVQACYQAELIAFDCETTSLDYMEAEVVGLSIALHSGEAAYIPLGHRSQQAQSNQLSADVVWRYCQPMLEDRYVAKVAHNVKYDLQVLWNAGVAVQGIAFDTMLESYVWDSTSNRHDLDTLSLKYLSRHNMSYSDVAGSGKNQINFADVELEPATRYAAEDADMSLQLHHTLWSKIAADSSLRQVFDEIELPLLRVLAQMEYHGVCLDVDLLYEQSEALGQQLATLRDQAHQLAGETFNLNSPKQLQHILYDKMGLPVVKKTPKGQPSTSESVLHELADDYELANIILQYRSLNKLKSTYTDRLPEQVSAKTGRVHTYFHQAVAGTGRLSSSEPNLQNIPARTMEGRKIRQAFVAPDGCQIMAADYSQIELRIMAHLSQDAKLIDAFHHNLDVHSATASQVFGVDLQQVNSEQRRKAKAINFGLIYGMSAYGLAKQIDVGRVAAQTYIDAYFEQYPGVWEYMERTRKKAKQLGYVETIFGRRLHLPDIHARNRALQQGAERAAINAPMQGSAADIIKKAMIAVQHWIDHSDIDLVMTMQVHDELIFEVAKADAEEARYRVNELMAHVAQLAVPLDVDIGIADNWQMAH